MGLDIVYNMKREMLRRGLSRKTVKAYLFFVQKFLLFMKDKEPKEFSKKDVRAFLYSLQDRDLAGSSLNVAHNALRFMMIDVLHKGMYLKIKFSKTPKKKPDYLTLEEIRMLLAVIQNEKHKLIVSLTVQG
jgi:site-specific recombinase XerD